MKALKETTTQKYFNVMLKAYKAKVFNKYFFRGIGIDHKIFYFLDEIGLTQPTEGGVKFKKKPTIEDAEKVHQYRLNKDRERKWYNKKQNQTALQFDELPQPQLWHTLRQVEITEEQAIEALKNSKNYTYEIYRIEKRML